MGTQFNGITRVLYATGDVRGSISKGQTSITNLLNEMEIAF